MLAKLFSNILPNDAVLTGENDLQKYGRDWLKDFPAKPSVILLPRTIAEVQEILRTCSAQKIAVVPSGGRTGLSGGATATQGEVVLSLEKMNRVLEVNRLDRTLRCEAGLITQKAQEEAAAHGLYFPLDFASKGSSQIGGNIATNAGGIRVLKYGNFRDWVLGLAVVTASGELLKLNGALYKNNTGYDLRNLMIGSEGTLGVIVEATLRLTQPPPEVTRILLGLPTIQAALDVYESMRDRFRELSAFEFFEHNALQKVMAHHRLSAPFAEAHPHYVVLELEGTGQAFHDASHGALEKFIEDGSVADAVISASSKQADALLAYRELISETLSSTSILHKNDLSVPISKIANFVPELQELIAQHYSGCELVLFGHIGDGNLHVNILNSSGLAPQAFYDFCKQRDPEIFALVQKHHGSISAEHGVGLLKRSFLDYSRSAAEIALMRGIKILLDPSEILNPGKLLPEKGVHTP